MSAPSRARAPNFINLAGQRFGKLTVLSLHPERGSRGELTWLCAGIDFSRRRSPS